MQVIDNLPRELNGGEATKGAKGVYLCRSLQMVLDFEPLGGFPGLLQRNLNRLPVAVPLGRCVAAFFGPVLDTFSDRRRTPESCSQRRGTQRFLAVRIGRAELPDDVGRVVGQFEERRLDLPIVLRLAQHSVRVEHGHLTPRPHGIERA